MVNKLKSGDLKAQAELYQLFSKASFNLALRILTNRASAEDVVHDVFIKIFRKIEGFANKSKFGFWLRRIVINECYDRIRRSKKEDISFSEDIMDASDSNLVNLSMAEAEYDLHSLLDRLPALARSVLWLHQVEGLRHQEIAEIFGKSESFSKMTLSRTLLELKKMVQISEPGVEECI